MKNEDMTVIYPCCDTANKMGKICPNHAIKWDESPQKEQRLLTTQDVIDVRNKYTKKSDDYMKIELTFKEFGEMIKKYSNPPCPKCSPYPYEFLLVDGKCHKCGYEIKRLNGMETP